MPAIKYRRETTSTETKRKMIYHSLLVKLADSLEIAFIRLTLQYFFSSIARRRVACRFFFENAISAIRVLCSIRALHRLQSWTK